MTGPDADEQRWAGHADSHAAHDKLHALEHVHEQELARHEEKRLAEALAAHDRDHSANALAVKTALSAVKELADIHAEAHAREHLAHETRHKDANDAIAKAEVGMDKRLASLNEFREQLREQARAFATNERLDALTNANDRRLADMSALIIDKYETNRQRIETLEKGDIGQTNKAEGRNLGQGTVVAIIVSAIGLVGTVLSIVIVLANFATGTP